MLNDAADEPLKAMEYFRKALHCAKTYNLPRSAKARHILPLHLLMKRPDIPILR